MKRPLDTIGAFRAARHRVRIAFLVLITFLVAQVLWWTGFQRNYIEMYVLQTREAWQLQAQLAHHDALDVKLPEHLIAKGSDVIVNEAVFEAFKNRQERYARMFSYEVPFFLLVMLLGFWVIWQSMQSDLELRRRQDNFLMSASHEFRTPISSLKLLLETLQLRVLDRDKQLQVVQRASVEVQRLHDTADRVLATARLESQELPVLAVQNLVLVTKNVLDSQRLALEARGAVLVFTPPPKNLLVLMDVHAFEIVLVNLLDNAIKYTNTASKPILVRVDTIEGAVCLSLEDRGIGIQPEESKYVFDQFYRVGSELTRVAKGLGLGLYLVKALTERMNGTVKLELLPVGTRFILSFPLQESL
jgi:signal transduction histidine kinase